MNKLLIKFLKGIESEDTGLFDITTILSEQNIELLWSMGGGKIQSSSDLVNSTPMLGPTTKEIDGVELQPSRIEIIQGDGVPKK